MPPTAATSTTGFFQVQPIVLNQWDEDTGLARVAGLFLPPKLAATLQPKLRSFAADVITPQIYDWIANAEHDLPYIAGSGFTAFGSPKPNSLVTSDGWKQLQAFGLREGIVAMGYEHDLAAYARVYQAMRLYLWCASAALVTCPSAMQDGAVAVLLREMLKDGPAPGYPDELQDARRKVFDNALSRLLSRDPSFAWTSGQWMTERAGGSDVAGTETVAVWAGRDDSATDIDVNPLGPWTVDGFKWFSSATDCGCVLFLAKTDDTGRLSCFFAPTRKYVNGREEMNGIRMQRLKNKLGTKTLPTAELELKGMRAWLVGEEGRGVAQISTVLNITRLYNAMCSSGQLGRGLAIVRSFARVRTLPSKKAPENVLREVPLFAKSLAGVAVMHRADTLLTHFVAALVGADDHPTSPHAPIIPRDPGAVAALVRIVTPITKAYTAKHSVWGVQECMESLGGVGYMENTENQEMNLARLFRDVNVLAIWEGTTDVLSTDTIKVLRGKTGTAVTQTLGAWIEHALSLGTARGLEDDKAAIRGAWVRVRDTVTRASFDEALSRGRQILWHLGDIISATLLVADAQRDGDAIAAEIARRFVGKHPVFRLDREPGKWRDETAWDKKILFAGDANPALEIKVNAKL
ncbi:acyl-CoA dehydrogenase [Cutaneotrichosporon oleaginosum]|uniref:Acyl-CoA dehydrogenase n=1 Tax=Cutaneotrichosporon oleaginosum TaxID=879819 RepID=A0A0J1BE47_9TREE|nr:acyl-CoA dehydrogenase [Cutaneotrichosporon oleaginosum]KLT46344.1 acyl-CoA dehydrogenase [Cutaneotrichosporon oleaginosum]TXT15284.1 hypothetical protein COLE_01477 [Cutaneotrichosporon oleaginosum]